MVQSFNKIDRVEGELKLPGDKSISHRAVMFAGMADGISTIENLSNADDVNSTINCFTQLGCSFEKEDKILKVQGRGFKGFTEPSQPLDAGNSGTTTRLLSGILSAQNFESTIIGDESLSMRPMKRIMDPLKLMGADISSTEKFTLPLVIKPVNELKPICYELPVASAQVKSAVLLAGIHLDEISTVIENVASRNHTELMLNLDAIKEEGKTKIFVSKKDYPVPGDYFVPSDISTASFFIILALLLKKARIIIKNVSLNKTRTGILDVLTQMGAKIEFLNQQRKMNEFFGDLVILNSELRNIEIPANLIANIIDEIPILSVAGVLGEGSFIIKDAEELRFKETDRINALCYNYRLLGLKVEEIKDGFEISGNIKNKDVIFESFHDHRIAMAFSIFSLITGIGKINNFECVSVSNPNFLSQLDNVIN